jgi:shikimate 5-dehydrogenase
MVYVPVRTELLRRASLVPSSWFGRRLHLVDGLTMLIGQAEEAFTLFFGEAPPPGAAPELRELLTR